MGMSKRCLNTGIASVAVCLLCMASICTASGAGTDYDNLPSARNAVYVTPDYVIKSRIYELIKQKLTRPDSQYGISSPKRLDSPFGISRPKRLGIIGLDNMDMMASTLDRERIHRPAIQPSISFTDLRRMLAAGK